MVDDEAVPVEVEEEATVPMAPLTMAELAVRCTCGCRRGKHIAVEWECMGGCLGCREFTPAGACANCSENGVEHIPEEWI